MNSDAVKYLLWIVAVAALIWAFYGEPGDNARVPVSIPYSEFKRLLADGEVAKVELRGHRADIVLNRAIVAGPKKRSTERVTTILPPMDDPDLLPALARADVELKNLPSEEGRGTILFYSLLPWLVFIGIYWLIWQRIQSNMPGGAGSRGAGDGGPLGHVERDRADGREGERSAPLSRP